MNYLERLEKRKKEEREILKGNFPDDMSFEHGSRIAINMLRENRDYTIPLKGFSRHYGIELPANKQEAISLIQMSRLIGESVRSLVVRGL